MGGVNGRGNKVDTVVWLLFCEVGKFCSITLMTNQRKYHGHFRTGKSMRVWEFQSIISSVYFLSAVVDQSVLTRQAVSFCFTERHSFLAVPLFVLLSFFVFIPFLTQSFVIFQSCQGRKSSNRVAALPLSFLFLFSSSVVSDSAVSEIWTVREQIGTRLLMLRNQKGSLCVLWSGTE